MKNKYNEESKLEWKPPTIFALEFGKTKSGVNAQEGEDDYNTTGDQSP